jgi:hypothetical protein
MEDRTVIEGKGFNSDPDSKTDDVSTERNAGDVDGVWDSESVGFKEDEDVFVDWKLVNDGWISKSVRVIDSEDVGVPGAEDG